MSTPHDIVHTPPAATHVSVAKSIMTNSKLPGTIPTAPLCANAGNVVAKALVGCGGPLTVTVGTALSGVKPLLVGLPPEARIVNLGEVACMTPCVEFMKMRK